MTTATLSHGANQKGRKGTWPEILICQGRLDQKRKFPGLLSCFPGSRSPGPTSLPLSKQKAEAGVSAKASHAQEFVSEASQGDSVLQFQNYRFLQTHKMPESCYSWHGNSHLSVLRAIP